MHVNIYTISLILIGIIVMEHSFIWITPIIVKGKFLHDGFSNPILGSIIKFQLKQNYLTIVRTEVFKTALILY